MLTLVFNKQHMWYALQIGYRYEYAKDRNGNIIQDFVDGKYVPRTTGEPVMQYSDPVEFYANIKGGISNTFGNGSKAEESAYGVSLADYDAIIYAMKGELPITETSLIWFDNEPKFKADGTVDPKSADYRVVRVPPVLDEVVYMLDRLDKNT